MYTLQHGLQWIIRVYHPQTQFCSCDLDVDPMTLIYESDLKLFEDVACLITGE